MPVGPKGEGEHNTHLKQHLNIENKGTGTLWQGQEAFYCDGGLSFSAKCLKPAWYLAGMLSHRVKLLCVA